MAEGHGTSHIIQSLLANLVIAIGKAIAAAATGSGALVAEALHSFSDCANQLLLLLGVRRARRPPDSSHPLGYGRALYFWSFMVAQLLFVGGGVFSVYEGLHKIVAPGQVERLWIGFGVLGFSFIVEGWATIGNIRELNARRGGTPFFRYLREAKDSDLIVVFGENSAAVLGLTFAMTSLGIAALTGDGRWDGVGSLLVGLVLIGVAVFLAIEVKSLLLGESADPSVERAARNAATADSRIQGVLRIITVQQGPGEVLLAAKLRISSKLDANEVARVINEFEVRLRTDCPEVRWSFVEPDVEQ